MNDWFIDAAKDKGLRCREGSQNEGVGEHKYRVYDNLKSWSPPQDDFCLC